MDQGPGLEDCLKLLKGERDEQRLVGLLMATKFCKGDDHASIIRVYDAVGVGFLDRLLKTGMGKGTISVKEGDNRDAYLQLSVTILAAFCRVPDIASSKEMVSKVPLILEILSKGLGLSFSEECYEILFLVSTASDDGPTILFESGGMNVLSSCMHALPDGSHSFELAMKLVQLMLGKLPLDVINMEYPSELSRVVAAIARQFALLHNALKFEALHLLSAILPSKNAALLHDALRSLLDDTWATYIRVGIVAVLQNRVAASEKLQALVLAESMMSILGEIWLVSQKNVPDIQCPVPVDKCLLLVLESSRVEVAVLLNDIAYLKFEASKSSSDTAGTILLRKRDLATAFSLIEKIIKLISNDTGSGANIISESTLTKVIAGLNETIGVVLEFLQDAKDHGDKKGDDLLASVRIIGSYLAEAPDACREKVQELLEYILSVEGEDEPSPFYSVRFMLPMLCQITMKVGGCKLLAKTRGYNVVVGCLVKLIGPDSQMVEDDGTIFLACDTVINFLLKREEIGVQLDVSSSACLLRALTYWAEDVNDPSIIMMSSSICSLIFDSTTEQSLLNGPDFEPSILNNLSRLIVRGLATCGQEMADDAKAEVDLHQILTAGYARWADRFPRIKQAVEMNQPMGY
ncbi:neurochondrin [Telopea speciosissima]|uniref:neurochondrin n=1 Tax=Telopea speciosissima TaxID=54955 RepID=UPI001CC62852|nr:neurochondrin [Telopea speciosissima]